MYLAHYGIDDNWRDDMLCEVLSPEGHGCLNDAVTDGQITRVGARDQSWAVGRRVHVCGEHKESFERRTARAMFQGGRIYAQPRS